MIDIEKAGNFPFEDPEWISKLGIGALVSLIPIFNLAWSGYLVGLIRNVMDEREPALPAWEDPAEKFYEGLILLAASVVYAAPILLAIFLPLGIMIVSSLSSGADVMQTILHSITGATGIGLFWLFLVMLLYGTVLSVIYPAILVTFAREGTFASCFKLSRAVKMIGKNPAEFFQVWGLSLAAGIGVSLLVGFINLVVGWVPCMGWIIGVGLSLGSTAYIGTVRAHLFGQFGRIAS